MQDQLIDGQIGSHTSVLIGWHALELMKPWHSTQQSHTHVFGTIQSKLEMLQGGHQVSTYKSKSNWFCQKARSHACTVAGEAHPETGATSGHSRRCMQPKQKHNDNAKPLKKPKKKRQETHAHSGPCCQSICCPRLPMPAVSWAWKRGSI